MLMHLSIETPIGEAKRGILLTNSRLIRDQMLLGGIGNCLVSVFKWLREKTTSLRDRLLVRSCISICICSALVRRANDDYKISKLC